MSKNLVSYSFNGVSFTVQEEHDFSWLQELGQLFTVFDEQDSGNIAFGIERGGKKRFVKYAGAMPREYSGKSEVGVERLKQAGELYKAIKHPNLITFETDLETSSGYALIFEWFEGECLHSHWLYAGERKYKHPDSPFYKFKQLSLPHKIQSVSTLIEFQSDVEKLGYIAVDLYDGSILYNFLTHETKICDIDFYQKKPVFNNLGENYWGSTRFKSPEEYQLGAVIDEQTNVFTIGALALYLLGGGLHGAREQWEANDALYAIAQKAVQQERTLRYGHVTELKEAWEQATGA